MDVTRVKIGRNFDWSAIIKLEKKIGAPITDFWHILNEVFIFVTKTLRFFDKITSISLFNNWQTTIKFGDVLYEISKMFAFFWDNPRVVK